jgi:DNA polymerase elongation subunit (family B)
MVVLDVECYTNYFLVSFKQISTNKVLNFELHEDSIFNVASVINVMDKNTTISFNGLRYDLIMITAATQGFNNLALKKLSDEIITSTLPSYLVCRNNNLQVPKTWQHIDLIDIPAGIASLKIYGGRLHAEKMQDLPIEPSALISKSDRDLLRTYCENDLDTTILLYDYLKPAIALRMSMSKQYEIDLRSKSDAQIAEQVIKSELTKVTGLKYSRLELEDDYSFKYQDPKIISFESNTLRQIFTDILDTNFTLIDKVSVQLNDFLKKTIIKIGKGKYRMGIGGLHSCEKSQYVVTSDSDSMVLADFDVASMYPSIILQQKMAPASLGKPFLDVYQSLVTRRLKAKATGDKITADTIKTVVNSSFGKFGSKWSALYAPDLLIQTTITGQLSLLMLIERLEDRGITVLSANTDGIVLYFNREQESVVEEITWDWMLDTSYELERTDYLAIASRDVNNYVAIKKDKSVKGKGIFADPGLAKNPDCGITTKAVALFLSKGICIEDTIRNCKDIRLFLVVRKVTGGAQTFQGEYLGKAVRFYYSTEIPKTDFISYCKSGNKVATSNGAKPLMTLTSDLPIDIDYQVYIDDAHALLKECGVNI